MLRVGRQTVGTLLVPEQMTVATFTPLCLTITALRTNTDFIAIGPREVSAAEGAELGILLAPGQSWLVPDSTPLTHINEYWISVRVAGEGVQWSAKS